MRRRHGSMGAVVRAVAVVGLVSGSAWAAGGMRYTTVVTMGQAAPGFGAGVTFAGGFGVAGSNATGQVPFDATVAGPGLPVDGETVVYRWANGTLDLVAHAGEAAEPLGAGATFGFVGTTSILANGSVAYTATTAGTGGGIVAPEYSQWLQAPGTKGPGQLVVRTGQTAPGVAGATLDSFYWVNFTAGGHVTWGSELSGAGFDPTKDRAVFGGPVGSPTVLLRTNTQAPGMAAGVQYSGIGEYAYRESGEMLFGGDYDGNGVGQGKGGALWYRDAGGNTSVIARGGDQAAGAPAGYRYAGGFTGLRMDGGNVVYRASLYAPGDSETRDAGVWTGPAGSAQLVLRTGQAAPGVAGAQLKAIDTFNPLSDGRVAVVGEMMGPGIDGLTNGTAVWDGAVDDLHIVWRQGEAAPGLAGLVTSGLTGFQSDDVGHYLLMAKLSGEGVTEANDEAMWLFDHGVAHLLAREGDTVVLDGVAWSVYTASGSLAPADSAVVTMWLARGSDENGWEYGVVQAEVPEPGVAGMMGLVGAGVMGWRRRRAGAELR